MRSVRDSSRRGFSVDSDMSEISESGDHVRRVNSQYEELGECTCVRIVVIVVVFEENLSVRP